jgi:hypothetical protein
MKIINDSKGPSVPIKRKGGAFTIEVDVSEEQEDGFKMAKKTIKAKAVQSNDMDVDAIVKGAWEAFWECRDCESESTFHGPM